MELSNEQEQSKNKPNGEYDLATNSIVIDLNANVTTKTLTELSLQALSHEVTHLIRKQSPAEWQELSDYVFDTLTSDGNTTREILIDEEIARLKKTHPETIKGKSTAEIVDIAEDEIVARACEDRLANSKAMQNFINEMAGIKTSLAKKFNKLIKSSVSGGFFTKISALQAKTTAENLEIPRKI